MDTGADAVPALKKAASLSGFLGGRARSVQPPKRTGQGTGRALRPDFGDGLQSLLVGELHQPPGDLGVVGAAAPVHQSLGRQMGSLGHPCRIRPAGK